MKNMHGKEYYYNTFNFFIIFNELKIKLKYNFFKNKRVETIIELSCNGMVMFYE